jgi:hypothetical protein
MRRTSVLLLLISLLLIPLAASLSQPSRTLGARVTAEPPKSLFVGDTCTAPCWFGLTPGISTSAEVELLLGNETLPFYGEATSGDFSSNIFDESIGILFTGQYDLFFYKYERKDIHQLNTRIAVENGTIKSIDVVMNRFITLGTALEYFGVPDQVVLRTGYISELSLFYNDEFLEINFDTGESLDYVSWWGEDICLHNSLLSAFWVDAIFYSDKAILPEMDVSSFETTANGGGIVPYEIWQPWFNGVTILCDTAIQKMMGGDQ